MRLTLFACVVIAITIARAQNTTSSDQWTTVSEDEKPQNWYQRFELINQISLYAYMSIGVLAVICNGIILRVMLKHKPTTPHIYLICIAVCDLLTGVAIIGNTLMGDKDLLWKYPTLRVVSFHIQVPCFFVKFALGDTSTFVLIALSLDRLIAIKHPMQHISWCTVRRARICCIVLTCFSFVWSTNVLLRFTSIWSPDRQTSIPAMVYSKTGKLPIVAAIAMHSKFVIQRAVPLFLMGITNTWTIQQVIKGDRLRRGISNLKEQAGSVKCMGMTLGITAYFLVTNAAAASYALNQAIDNNRALQNASIELSVFLYLLEVVRWTNAFMNFFFYLIFDRKFRQNTIMMFFGRPREAPGETSQMTTISFIRK
ncbi:hypothetical protein CAPTEDRAFT_201853 [Capitella teleta]|uniref:G-protein coupled receptors family 1 profile domain-containing protein n=1 Tax=Capitella teleta TaxID=283909 RepID=R7U9K1_CAPTE|nr:hypothetical protein CAPTEDRAFT_201853 [Capitella teleta]|eukprot:ELU03030.1 hypothetical protein CAPTEDRAFT_201853 [Capitella teleta]